MARVTTVRTGEEDNIHHTRACEIGGRFCEIEPSTERATKRPGVWPVRRKQPFYHTPGAVDAYHKDFNLIAFGCAGRSPRHDARE